MAENRFVVKLAGHQHLVSPGDRLVVDRLKEPVGAVVTTADLLTGATVRLQVIEERRGQKLRGLKFKNKTRYLRRWGHRQELTVLEVENAPPAVTDLPEKKKAPARKKIAALRPSTAAKTNRPATKPRS